MDFINNSTYNPKCGPINWAKNQTYYFHWPVIISHIELLKKLSLRDENIEIKKGTGSRRAKSHKVYSVTCGGNITDLKLATGNLVQG